MGYDNLKKKMDEVNKREISEEIRRKMEEEFEVDYTYDTLALSGSSLTKDEVRAILAVLKSRTEVINNWQKTKITRSSQPSSSSESRV